MLRKFRNNFFFELGLAVALGTRFEQDFLRAGLNDAVPDDHTVACELEERTTCGRPAAGLEREVIHNNLMDTHCFLKKPALHRVVNNKNRAGLFPVEFIHTESNLCFGFLFA